MTLPCTLELQSEDSQGDPNQAPPLARSLTENDELVAVVGPYFSGETLATGRSSARRTIVFVTPSATGATIDEQGFDDLLPSGGRRHHPGAGRGAATSRSLGATTVAVVHDNQDYSKGLADAVVAGLGGCRPPAPSSSPPRRPTTPRSSREVKATQPQIVFYGGYSPQAGPLLRQLREAGVEATFVSDDGTKDASFGDLAGPASEGALVTCPCVDPLQIPGRARSSSRGSRGPTTGLRGRSRPTPTTSPDDHPGPRGPVG